MGNDEQNELYVPEIKVIKNICGRPYRYQRNTNGGPSKGAKLVKQFLYWLKNIFLRTNESY